MRQGADRLGWEVEAPNGHLILNFMFANSHGFFCVSSTLHVSSIDVGGAIEVRSGIIAYPNDVIIASRRRFSLYGALGETTAERGAISG